MYLKVCDTIKTMQKKLTHNFDSLDSTIDFMRHKVLPGDFLIFYGSASRDHRGKPYKPEHFYSIVVSVDTMNSSNELGSDLRSIITLFNIETGRTERIFPSEDYEGHPLESAGYSGIELEIKDVIRP
jgi:hypothetical protein